MEMCWLCLWKVTAGLTEIVSACHGVFSPGVTSGLTVYYWLVSWNCTECLAHSNDILRVSCVNWCGTWLSCSHWICLFLFQMDKRESVLTMALEHGLIGFITDCISQWSRAGANSFTYLLMYLLLLSTCVCFVVCCVEWDDLDSTSNFTILLNLWTTTSFHV